MTRWLGAQASFSSPRPVFTPAASVPAIPALAAADGAAAAAAAAAAGRDETVQLYLLVGQLQGLSSRLGLGLG